MHREVPWMKPADPYILDFMASHGARMKPASIALNVPYSSNWVGQRCRALAKHGLLNSADGSYWISDRGKQFAADELEPADLLDEE